MSGIEQINSTTSSTDVNQLIQELREQISQKVAKSGDSVAQTGDSGDTLETGSALGALSDELSIQGAAVQGMDASRIAELISDPFEDA